MQHSRDRDGEGSSLDTAFADPAFAGLKARGAPFAILRPDARVVLWANAAAADGWGAADAEACAEVLFGSDGRGGWLDGLTRGLVPGRAARLVRGGVARGSAPPARTALIRAWTDPDGETLIALAVPDAEAGTPADPDAWRRPAWAVQPAAEPRDGRPDHADTAAPDAGEAEDEPADTGVVLARRGQLAVLRDRLSRAVDGAVTLRLLWRTDAEGAVVSIDAAAFARLGSPLRFDGVPLPDAVAAFDPEGGRRLSAALATRATWAGIAFELPVADRAATVPVALSASPVLGPERSFAGFRGFGIIDLGRLALSARPVPAPAKEGVGEADGAQDRDGPEVDAPAPPASVDAFTPLASVNAFASPASVDAFAPPASVDAPAPPAAAPEAPAIVPAVDDEPPAEARPAANVVQLRAFQGSASGRFGAAPVPSAAFEPASAAPAGTADGGSPAGLPPAPGDRPAGPQDEPLDDQLAFLALGEALRARIGASAPAPEPEDLPPSAEEPVADAPAPDAPDASQPASAGTAPSEEPASPLLDWLPIAVLATVSGRPVFANPAAAARLGFHDPRDLIGAGDALVVSSAEADRIELRDARGTVLTSAARRVEVPWAGASATLWLLSEPDQDGVAPEAADPRPAPAEAGEDRSTELLDRVDDAVALLDAAGRVRRLNRRGEGWFGRAEAEGAPARGFTDLLEPESRPVALALLGDVRKQRDGLGLPPLRRDVLARTGENGATPMVLTLGRLGASGFYATLRDVSALLRAETDRARTERDHARAAGRLPDLLAKVSHEIRTPLGAILGFAEVMMDERFGPLGNPRYKDYLKDIHASGTQVVALVDDLLDLSRIEAGQLDLDVAAVDVNRVVAEAVAQMQPEAHRVRVIMRTSLAGRIPAVLADERSTRQIVRNILSNAVKFNEPGGQVIVSTALGEAGAVLLRVRDTGVGMSEEEIAAALEPFGGLPARPRAHGNGLGLPLTRALVGANGASMTIRSRPREGTLVEVCFASAGEAEARRPA